MYILNIRKNTKNTKNGLTSKQIVGIEENKKILNEQTKAEKDLKRNKVQIGQVKATFKSNHINNYIECKC